MNSGTNFRRLLCNTLPSPTAMNADVAFERTSRLNPSVRLTGGCSVPPGFTSFCACGDHTTKSDPRTRAEHSLVCLNTCSARTRNLTMALACSPQLITCRAPRTAMRPSCVRPLQVNHNQCCLHSRVYSYEHICTSTRRLCLWAVCCLPGIEGNVQRD